MSRSDRSRSDWYAAARTAAAFLIRWQLVWVGVLAPLLLFPPLGKASMMLVLLLPAVWIIGLLTHDEPVPVTPLNGSLALLIAMVMMSVWVTFDLAFSTPKILGVVLGVATFFGVVEAVRRTRAENALDVFVAAGTLLAIVGLLGTNWIGKVPGLRGITSRMPAVIRGIPGQAEGFQPNAVAGALVMFLPLQIAFAVRSGSKGEELRRLVHIVALAIVTGTLLLTQSRNAWISLATGLAAWAIWQSRRTRLAVSGTLVCAAIVLAVGWSRFEPTVNRAAGAGIQADMISRIELWSRAVDAIRDFPITGLGMNTFRRVMPVLYPTLLTTSDMDVAHAHNHLLQAAVDLGLPGLIAYLALWFGVAGMLTRCIRAETDPDRRCLIGGLASGMLASFLFGTADAIALGAKVGIFFWVALALIVAIHQSVPDVPELSTA